MKVKSKIKCECGSMVDVTFKKPHAIERIFGLTHCPDCESRIKFFVRKNRINPAQVLFDVSVKPSELLLKLKEEETLTNEG